MNSQERVLFIQNAIENFNEELATIPPVKEETSAVFGTMTKREVILFSLCQKYGKIERAILFQVTGKDPYSVQAEDMGEYLKKFEEQQNPEQASLYKEAREAHKAFHEYLWKSIKAKIFWANQRGMKLALAPRYVIVGIPEKEITLLPKPMNRIPLVSHYD